MATWIIGSIVLASLIWAGYRTYKEHKSGDSCHSGCSSCPHGSQCGK
ncbi:FeoB-associated Cys-rich membrane protein [Defluviitalea phaphyphila]|nr:FeoB-associated Cys-rich membrane protein [Defluviitalea phaphyphila]